MPDDKPSGLSRRGFGSMDKARLHEVSSRGGKAVPADKRAFAMDPALASEAGKLGYKKGIASMKPKPKKTPDVAG